METIEYLRSSGDTCELYELNELNEENEEYEDGGLTSEDIKNYEDIRHGDIIYLPNSYRAISSFVYSEHGGIQRLSALGPGNGSGGISSSISKYIENPIDFYKAVITKVDIAFIKLDTKAHMPLLRKIAGDRDINPDIKFKYDCINECVFFKSAQLYDGTYNYELVLSPDIDSVYLTNIPFTDIDPINKRYMEKYIENYKKNSKEILQIGNKIYCDLKSPIGDASIKYSIKEIIYNKANNPIKIICNENPNYGRFGFLNKEYIFTYSIDKISNAPKWICKNLEFENDSYKKQFSPYKFNISEQNFL